MENTSYHVIGVMSGTSLDGIDLCYCKFDYNGHWNFKILITETVPYTDDWIDALGSAIDLNKDNISKLNVVYTDYLAITISKFIEQHDISQIDAVCSHGHTIFHQPEMGYTLQIGNLPHMTSILDQTVVCDFRVQDVELGGQGAPLVPIGDRLLFFDYDFCLNLGGFANVSYELDSNRIAYDICPVNIVLNHYTKMLELDYDDGGKIAASGQINQPLLNALNALPFYEQKPPKIAWIRMGEGSYFSAY